jgi:nucleoside-diphosphate-sugar epimerase
MDKNDGRVISNFINQALKNEDITIYGDGTYTRSFQYIDDLIEGLLKLMESNYKKPINIGNPNEYTILYLAELILLLTKSKSKIINLPKVEDDPKRRKPDISKAIDKLDWQPKINLIEGLTKTIGYYNSLEN